MNHFTQFDTESMGGAQTFKFSPIVNVSAIADPVASKVLLPVTFFGSAGWYNGLAMRDSLDFTETMDNVPAGPKYKTVITGFVPKLTPDTQTLFEEMRRIKHIVSLTDNNGNKMLSGHLRAGMTFTYSKASGRTPSGASGYQFTFSLEYSKPSRFYSF